MLTRLRALSLLFSAGLLLVAQEAKETAEKLAPYYPTPEAVAERMLRLGELKSTEKHFDLGSGDGRIVVLAARTFKAAATGVELDPDLWQQSTDRLKKLGLDKRARIIQGDLYKQDYSSADVVTVYLLPSSNRKIRPLLEKQLKPGARVVSHDFEFSDWKADTVEHVEDDGEGRSHTLYLYRR